MYYVLNICADSKIKWENIEHRAHAIYKYSMMNS